MGLGVWIFLLISLLIFLAFILISVLISPLGLRAFFSALASAPPPPVSVRVGKKPTFFEKAQPTRVFRFFFTKKTKKPTHSGFFLFSKCTGVIKLPKIRFVLNYR